MPVSVRRGSKQLVVKKVVEARWFPSLSWYTTKTCANSSLDWSIQVEFYLRAWRGSPNLMVGFCLPFLCFLFDPKPLAISKTCFNWSSICKKTYVFLLFHITQASSKKLQLNMCHEGISLYECMTQNSWSQVWGRNQYWKQTIFFIHIHILANHVL